MGNVVNLAATQDMGTAIAGSKQGRESGIPQIEPAGEGAECGQNAARCISDKAAPPDRAGAPGNSGDGM